MAMLSQLKPPRGAKRKTKRLGRGDASGHGGTSTKGHKGQRSRSSVNIRLGFEGGQMPLHRRSPKWGFTNFTKKYFNVVNIDSLAEKFENGAKVTPQTCKKMELLRRQKWPLKILGRGKLNKALHVSAHACSESARKSIEEAKGSVTILKTNAAA